MSLTTRDIGLFELAEEINARMAEWLLAMEASWTTVEQSEAICKVYFPRLNR
jgi:hypothetical protein